jgi:hypothetical protein
MPVRNIFYANPIYFLIKFRNSHCLQGSLFFPSNTITIILIIYSVQVVAELTQQVESESSHLGLLTRVESFFVLDSSRVAEYSDSS